MHKLSVERRAAPCCRREQPEHEDDFDFIVEREPRQQNVGERLDAGEERKHYPIHHPFDIFFDIFGPDCFVRCIGGIERSEQ